MQVGQYVEHLARVGLTIRVYKPCKYYPYERVDVVWKHTVEGEDSYFGEKYPRTTNKLRVLECKPARRIVVRGVALVVTAHGRVFNMHKCEVPQHMLHTYLF